jgi:hypothetical protein
MVWLQKCERFWTRSRRNQKQNKAASEKNVGSRLFQDFYSTGRDNSVVDPRCLSTVAYYLIFDPCQLYDYPATFDQVFDLLTINTIY